jgi:hypothetical protein
MAVAPWVVSDELWERLHAFLLRKLRAAGETAWMPWRGMFDFSTGSRRRTGSMAFSQFRWPPRISLGTETPSWRPRGPA